MEYSNIQDIVFDFQLYLHCLDVTCNIIFVINKIKALLFVGLFITFSKRCINIYTYNHMCFTAVIAVLNIFQSKWYVSST